MELMPKVVLLAEDSGEDAESIQIALRKADVANPVVVVPDGEDVIAYFEGEGRFADRKQFPMPHVLLLDLKMPRVDGFEVLEWIRTQPQLKDLLVVVLSGYHGLREVNAAYALGANSFLFKPGNPSEIRNLVKSFPEYWTPRVPAATNRRSRVQTLVGSD
jgi:CheY-like chemotaxis protein